MPVSTADKRAAFKKLHESGCFIIPNPFDVGSAIALPTSNGFGSTKQPLSCIFLNVARLSAVVTGMIFPSL